MGVVPTQDAHWSNANDNGMGRLANEASLRVWVEALGRWGKNVLQNLCKLETS